MRILHFDCSMGAAGDMLTASLLELFDDRETMLQRLNAIGIPGVNYTMESVKKHEIAGTHLRVRWNGAEEQTGCRHLHDGHPHQAHAHRTLFDLHNVVEGLNLPEDVREIIMRSSLEIQFVQLVKVKDSMNKLFQF